MSLIREVEKFDRLRGNKFWWRPIPPTRCGPNGFPRRRLSSSPEKGDGPRKVSGPELARWKIRPRPSLRRHCCMMLAYEEVLVRDLGITKKRVRQIESRVQKKLRPRAGKTSIRRNFARGLAVGSDERTGNRGAGSPPNAARTEEPGSTWQTLGGARPISPRPGTPR
jgi:hypothetical protein